jgi:predicted metal-binding protein
MDENPAENESREKPNLAEYRQLVLDTALKLRKNPAHEIDARVISADDVSFAPFQGLDVLDICRNRCPTVGPSPYCRDFPPVEETKARLKEAGEVILITIKVPTIEVTHDRWREPAYSGKGKRLLAQVLRVVETKARSDGYRKTWGMGSGPCKGVWCPKLPCTALQPGGKCRYPELAHRATEGHGVNVVETVRRQGIEIYYIGQGMLTPSMIPYGLCVGVLIVA